MTDRPKWLRPDGADERLVNPTADMELDFCDPTRSRCVKQDKTLFIKQFNPEFVQALLSLRDKIDKLDVLKTISSGAMPAQDVLDQHTQLVTEQLQLVEKFVKDKFNSVEEFMEWWQE